MSQTRRYLTGLLWLVPFGVLVVLHRTLGLSDAMLNAPKPGERYWPAYNPIMVLSFYVGLAACFWQMIWTWASGPERGQPGE